VSSPFQTKSNSTPQTPNGPRTPAPSAPRIIIKKKSYAFYIKQFFLDLKVLFLLTLFIIFIWYISPSSVTFCDNYVNNSDCTPCPANAICSNGEASCEPGYQLYGISCVEDKDAALMADKVLRILSIQQGRKICHEITSAELSEDELTLTIKNQREWRPEEVDLLFQKSRSLFQSRGIIEKMGRFETEKAIVGWFCSIKLFCSYYKWSIFFLCIILGVFLYVIRKRRIAVQESQLIEKVLEIIFERLQEVKRKGPENKGVAVIHLRDEIFPPSKVSNKYRDRIWNQVQMKIAKDARISSYVDSEHSVDQLTYWFWGADI